MPFGVTYPYLIGLVKAIFFNTLKPSYLVTYTLFYRGYQVKARVNPVTHPNIMIGGGAGLGVMDFLVNITPVVVVVFIVTILICVLLFRKSLQVAQEQKE